MAKTGGTTGQRIVRGALAGLVAGVVASFAMERVQALASGLLPPSDEEPSTSKAADAVAHATTGAELAEEDKPLGGQAVHYAVGAALGFAYGIAAEFRPGIASGYGAPFGLGTAVLLDEAGVPAAGLGAAPWATPPATHLYSLGAHLVFGATAEAVRRRMAASFEAA